MADFHSGAKNFFPLLHLDHDTIILKTLYRTGSQNMSPLQGFYNTTQTFQTCTRSLQLSPPSRHIPHHQSMRSLHASNTHIQSVYSHAFVYKYCITRPYPKQNTLYLPPFVVVSIFLTLFILAHFSSFYLCHTSFLSSRTFEVNYFFYRYKPTHAIDYTSTVSRVTISKLSSTRSSKISFGQF